MNVTQKQIAEKLNVSQALVARALKGDTVVAEKTRLRIRMAAQELGYNPSSNSAARELIGKRYGHSTQTGIIAVMFDQMNASTPRNLPYYGPVFDGMDAEAARLGLDICFCTLREANIPMGAPRTTEIPKLVRESRVDGLISLGYEPGFIDSIQSLGMPLVVFHTYAGTTNTVAPDDYDGARQATRHLLELGHRRIGFLGIKHEDLQPAVRRLRGFRDEMEAQGVPVREELVYSDLTMPKSTPETFCKGCNECAACVGWQRLLVHSGYKGHGALPFTALICYNDPAAMGVIQHAGNDGFSVPRDVSVVGFDDISLQYHFKPTITSVDFSRHDLGAQAVRLLHKLINSSGPAVVEVEGQMHYENPVFPVKLSVRESTSKLEVE